MTLVRLPPRTATVIGRPGFTRPRPLAGVIERCAALTGGGADAGPLDAGWLLPAMSLHALAIARHSASAIPATTAEGDRLIGRTVGDGRAARSVLGAYRPGGRGATGNGAVGSCRVVGWSASSCRASSSAICSARERSGTWSRRGMGMGVSDMLGKAV